MTFEHVCWFISYLRQYCTYIELVTCAFGRHLAKFIDDFVILDLLREVADDGLLIGLAVAGREGLLCLMLGLLLHKLRMLGE